MAIRHAAQEFAHSIENACIGLIHIPPEQRSIALKFKRNKMVRQCCRESEIFDPAAVFPTFTLVIVVAAVVVVIVIVVNVVVVVVVVIALEAVVVVVVIGIAAAKNVAVAIAITTVVDIIGVIVVVVQNFLSRFLKLSDRWTTSSDFMAPSNKQTNTQLLKHHSSASDGHCSVKFLCQGFFLVCAF